MGACRASLQKWINNPPSCKAAVDRPANRNTGTLGMISTRKTASPWESMIVESRYNLSKPAKLVSDLLREYAGGISGRGLDLGCGLGRHLATVDEYGFIPFGLDISTQAVKSSSKVAAVISGGFMIRADMSHMPLRDGSFELILAWRSLYLNTVEKIRLAVREINRTLKPGGVLIASIRSTSNSLFFVGRERGVEIEKNTFRVSVADGAPEIIYHFFDETEVKELFYGYEIKRLMEVPLAHTKYTAELPHENLFWVLAARKVAV